MAFPSSMPQVNDLFAGVSKIATEAAEFNRANLDAVASSAQIWTAGVQELNQRFFATAQHLTETLVTSAKALTSATTLQDVATIQMSYFRSVTERLTTEGTHFSEAAPQILQQSAAPIAGQVASASEKLRTLPLAA